MERRSCLIVCVTFILGSYFKILYQLSILMSTLKCSLEIQNIAFPQNFIRKPRMFHVGLYISCLCILPSLITITSFWTMGKRGVKQRDNKMAQWGFWVNVGLMQLMNFVIGSGVGRNDQRREFPLEVWQCSSFCKLQCNVARSSGSSSVVLYCH